MDDLNLVTLSQESDGLSPADIKESIDSIVRKRAVQEADDMADGALKTPITMEELTKSIQHLKTSNGRTNQLLKSFSAEELKKLPMKQQAYVSEAVRQLLAELHVQELRDAVKSGKITAGSLQ